MKWIPDVILNFISCCHPRNLLFKDINFKISKPLSYVNKYQHYSKPFHYKQICVRLTTREKHEKQKLLWQKNSVFSPFFLKSSYLLFLRFPDFKKVDFCFYIQIWATEEHLKIDNNYIYWRIFVQNWLLHYILLRTFYITLFCSGFEYRYAYLDILI